MTDYSKREFFPDLFNPVHTYKFHLEFVDWDSDVICPEQCDDFEDLVEFLPQYVLLYNPNRFSIIVEQVETGKWDFVGYMHLEGYWLAPSYSRLYDAEEKDEEI